MNTIPEKSDSNDQTQKEYLERFNNRARYDALMDVICMRKTNRSFDPNYVVPDEHYELILEAARHAPSGANAQPWHYIIVRDPEIKEQLGNHFLKEQKRRSKLKMHFPTPSYRGMKTAPGLLVVATDFRFIRAFPVLNDDSELDRMYKENAERILLQSVAASTMSAHLAAAALGYAVWWVTAVGQQYTQDKFKPILGVPDALSIIDIVCFGPPEKPSRTRWKKELNEIINWDHFNPHNYWTNEMIDDWINNNRSDVIYRNDTHAEQD